MNKKAIYMRLVVFAIGIAIGSFIRLISDEVSGEIIVTMILCIGYGSLTAYVSIRWEI